ncbi:MAG TPA: hypothetical protein VFA94_14915 [Acidimicrobiales bacterium]|nr:hypothetical protein [Acidimicrobiales bacterium]
MGAVLSALVSVLALITTSAAPVAAADNQKVTYSATITVPAPPASNFAGASGGGDGWAVALTSSQLFNVFHHDSTLIVNCHNQSDASDCWSGPKTVVDGSGNNFETSIGPGLYVDQATGFMYVTVTRASDSTAGVACVDTTQPAGATGAQLFCGFTPLSAVGDAQAGGSGLSAPVQVGSRWYAYNEVAGSGTTGTENTLLCFDLSTLAACAGQPYAIDRGGVDFSPFTYSWPIGAAGSKIILQVAGSTDKLACFDTATNSSCGGSWPVTVASTAGAPFPLMDSSGNVTGVCTPISGIPCFDLTGATVSTPAGMTTAIQPTINYNGPAVTIGPRVYVPDANNDQVECYDYNQGAGCANFPKTFSNLGLLYTVNPDPQRPACLWVNADNGSAQIQNFDAFTGGACGTGAIRVLSSSIVVPNSVCIPASYTSLQVLSPPRNTYSSGSVDFQDGSGNPIPGFATHGLDGTGTANLTDLQLSTKTALPQFLITLNNTGGAPASVQVKLTWTGTFSNTCTKQGTTVTGLLNQGYRIVAGDGGVFAFGNSAFAGSPGATRLGGAIVGIAPTPSGNGYWLVGEDGGVFAYGDAVFAGSVPGLGIRIRNVRGIAATPSGRGYWVVGDDGGVFSFGDAAFFGSVPGVGVATRGVKGMAATPTGRGYWLVGDDGGVFAFGDAAFFGSVPGLGIRVRDVRGMAATPSGRGYWLVEGNGGVFSFGDATYAGSAPGLGMRITDVQGMAATPSGNGYWLVEGNGGVLSFGDASFFGSLVVSKLNAAPVAISR